MVNKEGKTCDKCGEILEVCENCETTTCPVCGEYERWGQDVEGCEFCPECLQMLKDEYNKETANGTKVCGACMLFDAEDDEGYGWCEFHQDSRRRSDYCENRLPKYE